MVVELWRKELSELFGRPIAVLALLAVSVVVFVLSQQFISGTGSFRAAVWNSNGECKSDKSVRSLLSEDPLVTVASGAPSPGESYWTFMDRSRIKVLFSCSAVGDAELWTVFVSVRNTEERQRIAFDVNLLEASLRAGTPWYWIQRQSDEPARGNATGQDAKGAEQAALSGRPDAEEIEAFPSSYMNLAVRAGSVREGSTWLMPGMGLLLSLLITFQSASSALVREVTGSTWHWFRLGRGVSAGGLVLGKLLVPIVLGLLSAVLYLALGIVFGLGLKPDMLLAFVIFQVPCILAVALQGLAVSCLLRNEAEALMASAAYLLGMIILTGIIAPIEYAGDLIKVAGFIFPLTHALPAIQATALHGSNAMNFGSGAALVLGISAASAFVALGLIQARLKTY